VTVLSPLRLVPAIIFRVLFVAIETVPPLLRDVPAVHPVPKPFVAGVVPFVV